MAREFSFLSRRRYRALAVLASTFLIFTSIGVVSTEAASFKPYYISGIPGSKNACPAANASTTVDLTLTDMTKTQTLGSFQVAVSPGFALTSTDPHATVVNDRLVTFQNLNIQPNGATGHVLFSVTPTTVPSTVTWTFTAQQSNQWQSSNTANYLTLAKATWTDGTSVGTGTSAVSQTLTSTYASTSSPSCFLRFVPAGGVAVADAEVFGGPDPSAQTLTAGSPGSGLGVKVGVYDSSGNLVTSGSITVTVAQSPAASALGGTTVGTTSGGYVTFGSLTDGTTGSFTLTASSPDASSATSNPFKVFPVLKPCDATKSVCTVTWPTTDSGVSSTITAPNGTASYFAGGTDPTGLTVSCAFDPFDYSDVYNPDITWYSYVNAGSGTKTVVRTIPKTVVQQTANNGTSFYRVCFASPMPFDTGTVTGYSASDGTQLSGGTGAVPILPSTQPPYATNDARYAGNNATDFFGATWYVGTLPPCGNAGAANAPCDDGTVGTGGKRITTFYLTASDPIYR